MREIQHCKTDDKMEHDLDISMDSVLQIAARDIWTFYFGIRLYYPLKRCDWLQMFASGRAEATGGVTS